MQRSVLTAAFSNAPYKFSPKPGPCKALKPKHFFDAFSNTCKTFNYGGCDGNANIFETEIFANISANSTVRKTTSGYKL